MTLLNTNRQFFTTLLLFTKNGLSALFANDGNNAGRIRVSGTATFDPGTFVAPVATPDASFGKRLILTSDNDIAYNGLDLVPGAKNGWWHLIREPRALYFTYSAPTTVVIVR